MKKITTLSLALFLGACSSTPRTISLPDGSVGYAVDCSGTRSDMADCMNKAAEVCGGRYAVISQNESTVGGIALSPTVMGAAIRRSMVVSCD